MNIDKMRTAKWSYDISQDVLHWSADLSHILELGEEADSMSIESYRGCIHAKDRRRFVETFEEAIRDGGHLYVDYRILGASGKEHKVVHLGIVTMGQNRAPNTLEGILIDVTGIDFTASEGLEPNRRLAALEKEAQTAKDNLSEFTYHASHDLNAPLRSVIGFSELVLEDYSDKLDLRGKDYLSRIVLQAKHMEDMLDDLLRLSRVMTHSVKWQRLDLSRMASEIAYRTIAPLPHRSYDLAIEEGMTCIGDRELIDTALSCLFDNAIKFNEANPVKIEFGKIPEKGEDRFFIRDNGVGFESAYKDRLFKPFQRLHSKKDYPGNGIGLAVAAAVMEKLGGRIWAESMINRGSTFYFVVGKAPWHNEVLKH
jgi:signal transduction histidine kinase